MLYAAGGLASFETGEAAGSLRRSPGEFSQHDFGQVEVEFRNGASQRIHFFASRLKYSRLVRVSFGGDEAVESFGAHVGRASSQLGRTSPVVCV